MRWLKGALIPLALCFCANMALANSIPISGSFQFAPEDSMSAQVNGSGFSLSTWYGIPDSRDDLGAPPLGETSTVDVEVGISDYESFRDGTPVDLAQLNGIAAVAEGEVDLSITYDPSAPGDPAEYASSASGSATFTGSVGGYTCEPALPEGCYPGTELWSVDLSGSGTATVTQSPDGFVGEYELDITNGAATYDDPPAAAEPSAALLAALAVLPAVILRRRYAAR